MYVSIGIFPCSDQFCPRFSSTPSLSTFANSLMLSTALTKSSLSGRSYIMIWVKLSAIHAPTIYSKDAMKVWLYFLRISLRTNVFFSLLIAANACQTPRTIPYTTRSIYPNPNGPYECGSTATYSCTNGVLGGFGFQQNTLTTTCESSGSWNPPISLNCQAPCKCIIHSFKILVTQGGC